MTNFKLTDEEKTHPLEDVFDIEPKTTMVPALQPVSTDIVTTHQYDDKDVEIEEQLQEVYISAMGQFEEQSEAGRNVEGKYKARNGEVAIQALKVALDAVTNKSTVKHNKDKLAENSKTPKTQNNNIILTDRNDLLKLMGKEPLE